MNKWISVEDRLPECKAIVHGPEERTSAAVLLFSTEYGIITGYLDEVDHERYNWIAIQINGNYLVTNITHWMPLPSEPDELPKP